MFLWTSAIVALAWLKDQIDSALLLSFIDVLVFLAISNLYSFLSFWLHHPPCLFSTLFVTIMVNSSSFSHSPTTVLSFQLIFRSVGKLFFGLLFLPHSLTKLFFVDGTTLFLPLSTLASGQLQSPYITLHQCQSPLQQVQESAGQHHALRDYTCLPSANQRPRRIWLHQF